jgi:hypothetical protein
MPFSAVIGAKRKVTVVSMAAVSGIRKQHILVLVIADPVPATIDPYDVLCLATQTASWFDRLPSGWFFWHVIDFCISKGTMNYQPNFVHLFWQITSCNTVLAA